MKLLRAVLAVLQTVWPDGAAWLAERLFFTPARGKSAPAGHLALASARRFTLRVEGRRVVGWQWGERDTPIVYLVHGWGSRGSRLTAFTSPLLAAGYSVVTYDAPGHGASGWGMSSMPEFARTLAAVVAREGTEGLPATLIAHSFGCSSAALAVAWGLGVERLVFLAPAADPPAWLHPFISTLRLRPDTIRRLRERSERRLRVRWSDLNVCNIVRGLPAHAPLLIVHDRQDETVAWDDGAAIAAAWPGARMVTTSGLGHRGVTHDDDVVRQAVAFVTAPSAPTAWRRHSESWQLEHELFFRGERPWSSRFESGRSPLDLRSR